MMGETEGGGEGGWQGGPSQSKRPSQIKYNVLLPPQICCQVA